MTNPEWRGTLDVARLRKMLIGAVGGSLVALAAGAPVAQAQPAGPGVMVAYPVPAGAPTGEVDVLSLGVAELPVPSLIGTESFVHMRLAAINRQDDQEWIVDARDQVLDLADGRAVEPRYALVGGVGGRPRLILRKGERGYLDLFFALDGANPPWAAMTWKVRRRAGAEAIVATTVFERLPAHDPDYTHLRPSQYAGAVLWTGPFWCEPRWSGRWFHPYGRYRRYRYAGHAGGFDVSDGRTRWRYEREQPQPAAPRESVGTHWRERAPAAPAVVAHPAPLTDPGIDRERFSWRLKIDDTVRRSESSGGGNVGGNGSGGGWSHVGESWRARGQSDESHSSRSLSDSSNSSPPSSSSSPPSSSDSSPSSSSSSPSPSPSSSSGSSVGSHWRSRH